MFLLGEKTGIKKSVRVSLSHGFWERLAWVSSENSREARDGFTPFDYVYLPGSRVRHQRRMRRKPSLSKTTPKIGEVDRSRRCSRPAQLSRPATRGSVTQCCDINPSQRHAVVSRTGCDSRCVLLRGERVVNMASVVFRGRGRLQMLPSQQEVQIWKKPGLTWLFEKHQYHGIKT